MWFLTSQHDARIIYILPQKEIIIGRSVDSQYCNFAIPDDASLSRKHASLSVSENMLYLQDLGSKYGTFVNNTSEKLECNIKQKIDVGAIVKFGKMNSEWKVHFINFTSCSSTLKGENLQSLKVNLDKLGGSLKSEWDDSCAYLTMPTITLTIKVVLALVQGAYIVTTEFWRKCIESVMDCAILPDPKNYIPQVVESTLNKEMVSFLPNSNRKTLFAGKTVIFFSRRQLEMYKNILVNSSATILLLSESKMTKSMLCDENIIIIQYNLTSTSQETQMQKNQINEILIYLKSKGKRVVADAEIGLAVLYCSLNKYCNPDFHFSSEMIKQTSDIGVKQTNILAHESEEPIPNILKKENVLINESLITKIDPNHVPKTNNNDNIAFKRKWDDEDNIENAINPNKKLDVEKEKASNNELNTFKRACDDTENFNNPSKKIALERTNNDNNIFDFMESTSRVTSVEDGKNKLNLTKPLKRKQVLIENEDDNLFNFVEDNPKPTKLMKAINCDKTDIYTESNITKEIRKTSISTDDKFDISALRGIKVEELLQNNLKMEYTAVRNVNIKTEDVTELDGKLNDLDLGSTTLNLRNDLIVKKEPYEISLDDSKIKNFKKFKKVWPVKMQISIIPKISTSTALDESGKSTLLSEIL